MDKDEWIKREGLFFVKNWKSEIERREYVQELMNRGFYETEAVYTGDTPLLFLVTYSYHHRNGRIVVGGMLKD